MLTGSRNGHLPGTALRDTLRVASDLITTLEPLAQTALNRHIVFTMRLHVIQCTVLLSQFCLSVRPSVCPSVRCVYCDKTKQRTANILTNTAVMSADEFLVPQIDRKSKQVKKNSDMENFICNQYGEQLAILNIGNIKICR